MHAGGASDSRNGSNLLSEETHVRVLDINERRPIGYEINALTEPSLYIIRARVDEPGNLTISSRVEVSDERLGPLSLLRHRDLTTIANDSLVDELMKIIEEDPQRHLDFYNRANNISLKMHAFQLLPGIGNSKAQKMVQSRGMAGWMSFSEVDEACEIESIRLLAERYEMEMSDSSNTLRLLDFLVRSD